MDEKTLFLRFWEHEATTTRRVLARIPEGSDYRPDPKTRLAREIAWQITLEMRLLAEGIARGSLDWAMRATPPTMKEILTEYDRQLEGGKAQLRAADAGRWAAPLPFTAGGRELNVSTGYKMAWSFLFDIIHHRGQITTYLRPMGSTVPQVYGPTADEP